MFFQQDFQQGKEPAGDVNPRGDRGRFRRGRGFRGRRRGGRRGRGPGRAFVPREYGSRWAEDEVSTLENAGEVDLRWAMKRFYAEQQERKVDPALGEIVFPIQTSAEAEKHPTSWLIREIAGRAVMQMEITERYFSGLAQLTSHRICPAFPDYDWRFNETSVKNVSELIEEVEQLARNAEEILRFADKGLRELKQEEAEVRETDLGEGEPLQSRSSRIARCVGLIGVPVAVMAGVYLLRK